MLFRSFKPEFLALNPNNKIPIIVDREGYDGRATTVVESGAILIYLAEKAGRFLPRDPARRMLAMQWLMFQMASVGPIFGQSIHFSVHAPERLPYAINRFLRESHRLFWVMEKRLGEAEYFAEEYSIADMSVYPWARNWERRGIRIEEHPNLARWLDAVKSREAVRRGVSVLGERERHGPLGKTEQNVLFGEIQYQRR